ncbi:HET-domain-containing protein [Hypoxylon sp. NC1633]|nr:HET-domain-containing protein [Hypoxylon sp. NC1633]
MKLYKYTPLDSSTDDIRLVTILPGKFKDPIRIEITHAPLVPPVNNGKTERCSLEEIQKTLPEDWEAHKTLEGRVFFNYQGAYSSWSHPDPDVPREAYDPINQANEQPQLDYEALSYTWGSLKRKKKARVPSKPIHLGQLKIASRNQYLPITGSLAEAIPYLRYEDRSRVMWIGAICIDQKDEKEVSEQVKRMGQIYSLARRVVAWLGTGDIRIIKVAFAQLNHFGRVVEPTPYRMGMPSVYFQENASRFSRSALNMVTWGTVLHICLRTWFQRLWIVQEIHLGSADSILQCGHETVLWSLFRRAVICMYGKDWDVPSELAWEVKRLMNLCFGHQNDHFDKILYDVSNRPCKIAKDKVYGLLNLAPPEICRLIHVNYSQSDAETFKQVFLTCSQREDRVSQLLFSGRRRSTSTSTTSPTWVPDWSQSPPITMFPNFGYCASGISASRARHISPNKLQVSGLSFSAISQVASRAEIGDFSDFPKAYADIDLSRWEGQPYPIGGTYQEAWLRTVVKDLLDEKVPGNPTLATVAKVVMTMTRGYGKYMLLQRYMVDAIEELKRSCLFSLENGYVGIIRGKPQQDDEVFVILGCYVPMILRRTPAGEYEVVGDCYVLGIMEGEAVLGSLPPPWKAIIKPNIYAHHRLHYINKDTGDSSGDDPRLDEIPIPPEWEPMEWKTTRADPYYCRMFRNKETGEVINSDPRLFPEALVERGIPVKTITLV